LFVVHLEHMESLLPHKYTASIWTYLRGDGRKSWFQTLSTTESYKLTHTDVIRSYKLNMFHLLSCFMYWTVFLMYNSRKQTILQSSEQIYYIITFQISLSGSYNCYSVSLFKCLKTYVKFLNKLKNQYVNSWTKGKHDYWPKNTTGEYQKMNKKRLL
jgi:hypothetical protein